MTLSKVFYLYKPLLSQLSNGDNFKSYIEIIPNILVAKIGKAGLCPRELNLGIKTLNRKQRAI